jgi:hypothetical protein
MAKRVSEFTKAIAQEAKQAQPARAAR